MLPLIGKSEPQRHYSIENYRASAPPRGWVKPTPTPIEIKQRHDVERLAAGSGYCKYKNVRQASEDCLPALRIVAQQRRAQVSLLRAANSHTICTDDLVLPAETIFEVSSSEMLRASTAEIIE